MKRPDKDVIRVTIKPADIFKLLKVSARELAAAQRAVDKVLRIAAGITQRQREQAKRKKKSQSNRRSGRHLVGRVR